MKAYNIKPKYSTHALLLVLAILLIAVIYSTVLLDNDEIKASSDKFYLDRCSSTSLSIKETAINTVKSYIIRSAPEIWSMFHDNLSVRCYDSRILEFLGTSAYEVYSRTSYRYPNEPNITVIVELGATVVIDKDSSYVVSLFLGAGNYYNSSVLDALTEKYDGNASFILTDAKRWVVREKLVGIENIYSIVLDDINTTLSVFEFNTTGYQRQLFSDPSMLNGTNVEYVVYKDLGEEHWILYAGYLGDDSYYVYPVRIYLMYNYNDGVLVYDNYVKVIARKYLGTIEQFNPQIYVTRDEAIDIAYNAIGEKDLVLVNGPIPILLMKSSGDLRLYYYLEYVNRDQSIGYQVFVDAIDGSFKKYSGCLACIGSLEETPDTNMTGGDRIELLDVIVGVSIVYIGLLMIVYFKLGVR